MIRFGCLGVATITASALVDPCASEPRAQIVAIAARDRARAQCFANSAQIPTVLDSYSDVITNPEVDAVYIPLPISAHHEWTIRALQAGKHVLCEKSMASNAVEAKEMAIVSKETGLILMEAFHYRYHPVFIRAKEIVNSGALGKIRHIAGEFRIPATDPDNIRMKYDTGGGVTMDIGCYPISWIRHLTGEEPEVIRVSVKTGPPNVDVMLRAKIRFPSGIMASTLGDMRKKRFYRRLPFHAVLRVKGDQGQMEVINPVVPQFGNEIKLTINKNTTRESFDLRPTYCYQLDAFIAAVESGLPPHTNAEDGVKQMEVIDAYYRAANLPLRGLR